MKIIKEYTNQEGDIIRISVDKGRLRYSICGIRYINKVLTEDDINRSNCVELIQKRKRRIKNGKNRTLHHLVVDKVYRFLVKESKSHIINNTPSRNKRYWARLKLTGEHVYPDIVDVDNKLVYEIHIKGENRREYFDKLSDRWKGINVFIEEAHSPETLVVKVGKFGGFKAKRIAWRVRKKERYIDAVKPMISQISEQIAKGEIFEVGTKDIVKQIGLFDDDIADVVCGLMYVLFDDGYYVSRSGEKIMIRKKKEGDILPDYLPEYMEQWEEFEDDTKKVLFR